jgi:hypothetical protein
MSLTREFIETMQAGIIAHGSSLDAAAVRQAQAIAQTTKTEPKMS